MFARYLVSALLASTVAARNPGQAIPLSHIIEFEYGADRASILSDVRTKVVTDFDSSLFQGASVRFVDEDHEKQQLARLLSMPSVKNVWSNKYVPRPTARVEWTAQSSSIDLESSHAIKRANKNSTYSPHVMTQIDKLHAKGITGKNVKIAVIDSGIDYTLDALGGCFGGDDCIVAGGYDFVGDKYSPGADPVPDNDPLDQCSGHGTHVAGIISARENKYGFVGAAPGAKLYAYRVFGCEGSAGDDIIISAFLRAHADGANIITVSIGQAAGWSEWGSAVVLSRIVAQGVIATVSTGNDGDTGTFSTSSPAGGINVTAIASFANTIEPWLQSQSRFSIDQGKEQDFVYAIGTPRKWGGVKLPLWAPSFNATAVDMGCEPFPDDTPDLSGKIVLMRRGTCTSTAKARNAVAKGARYLMYYNNVPGAIYLYISEVKNISSIGMVEAAVGEKWVNDLAAGKTITLDMSDPDAGPIKFVETPNTWTGGSVSDFSSWGLTYEADLKPQFGTPGENIISTFPAPLGSYAVLSGTSMSTPLAAGIYALLAEARGTFDPLVLQNILAATAKPALINVNRVFGTSLAPVAQQGAGLLQAYDAAYAVTVLSESSLNFNDTVHLVDKSFTISNTGSEAVTYELDVIGAATAYTFSNSTIPDPFPGLKTDDAHATVHLSTYKTTVPAGGKHSITVKVTPPLVDASRLPLYSGYIRLNATNGERLSLPYQGIAGDMSSHVVLNSTVTLMRSLPNGDTVPITPDNSTFLMARPINSTSNDNDDLPSYSYALDFGSPLVHVEILSVGNGTTRNLGDVRYSPLPYYARTNFTSLWFGSLASNYSLPAGTYKIRVRAMHLLSTPEDNKFDIVDTVPFTIQWR